jgi:hypothetical protein
MRHRGRNIRLCGQECFAFAELLEDGLRGFEDLRCIQRRQLIGGGRAERV